GFRLIFLFRSRDETASNDNHRPARDHRIQEAGDDEKARNPYDHAISMQVKRTADRPQHHNERRRRKERRYQPGNEVHRRVGGDPNVISYAILGILSGTPHKIELIIMTVLKPPID